MMECHDEKLHRRDWQDIQELGDPDIRYESDYQPDTEEKEDSERKR